MFASRPVIGHSASNRVIFPGQRSADAVSCVFQQHRLFVRRNASWRRTAISRHASGNPARRHSDFEFGTSANTSPLGRINFAEVYWNSSNRRSSPEESLIAEYNNSCWSGGKVSPAPRPDGEGAISFDRWVA
jgi:hypothetical protein